MRSGLRGLTTSAGLVFVWRVRSRAPEFAPVTPLKTFVTEPIMPPYEISRVMSQKHSSDVEVRTISPRAYELTAPRRPCAASAARLGSLILPSCEYTYGRSTRGECSAQEFLVERSSPMTEPEWHDCELLGQSGT